MRNKNDQPRALRLTAVAVAAALIAGCTLGPDPERPVTAADGAPSYVNAVQEAPPPAGNLVWWERFGDPITADLVRLALENNTDLQAAAARVLEAEALLRAAGGARLPQVGYGTSVIRQRSSFVLPQVGRITPKSTTYAYDLNVSWQMDLFGKLKRNRQAAWASMLAEEAAAEAVMHSVIAAVVRARVQVATLERALAITAGIRESRESTLRTVDHRYRTGLTGALDLYSARENLSSAKAAEVTLEGSLSPARHALDVLVGRRPGSGPLLPDTLPELPDLEPVPVGLPVELLDRRPDLRGSELRLAAATYGVGTALADLYPSLSLTASRGGRSDTLTDLLSSEALVYNAVVGLLGPIFAGGQIRANVDGARARMEQAAASYAGAVLQALRDVENALVAGDTLREVLEHNKRRVVEAEAADRLANDRYKRGVETLLRVLDTERRLRAAQNALITTTAELWNVRIDLFLALGGDWGSGDAGSGHGEEAEIDAAVGPASDSQDPQLENEVS
jgi:multidrug efflux system outer membrane protein